MASAEENHVSSDTDEGGEIQLELVEQTLGTLDLRESEIYPSKHGKRRRRRRKEETKMDNDTRPTSPCHHAGDYSCFIENQAVKKRKTDKSSARSMKFLIHVFQI